MKFPMPSKGFFRLSEVAAIMQELVEVGFSEYIWIRAEIVKLTVYGQKGHCYLTLAEKQNGQIIAEFRANIWAFDFRRIEASFRKEVGEDLRQGLEVMIFGRPSYHPHYGLSLNIKDIDTRFSQGMMARQRQQTLEWLHKEGLMELNKSKRLSALPCRIAVISEAASDGYRDFHVKLIEQAPHFNIQIALFPARLQGEAAVNDIALRLKEIAQQQDEYDLCCIVRGGGGEVGMSCYDQVALVAEIAKHPLPVLTGIGHSTNLTVAEQIAWKNLITPTDLGYFILDRFKSAEIRLMEAYAKLNDLTSGYLSDQNEKLSKLSRDVMSKCNAHINNAHQGLSYLSGIFEKEVRSVTRLNRERLQGFTLHLNRAAERLQKTNRQELELWQTALLHNGNERLFRALQKLNMLQTKKELLDPMRALQRGYSITRYHGKSIFNADQLPPDAALEIEVLHGKIDAHFIKFESHERKKD